jgi:hypothetical protein
MRTAGSKLLIMLVLLVAISTATWSTADARSRSWYRNGHSGRSAGSGYVVGAGSRSGIGVFSGEPDSSQPTKNSPTGTGIASPTAGSLAGSDPSSLSWTNVVWMARFLLGVR